MQHWVFTVGTRETPPADDWLVQWPHHVDEMWFPDHKRPHAVSQGDRALIYGSHKRGFIAAVEVVSDQPEPNTDPRYVWKLRHRLLIAKGADQHVAAPEDAGISTRRVMRGPHTTISPEDYHRGLDALLDAARRAAA